MLIIVDTKPWLLVAVVCFPWHVLHSEPFHTVMGFVGGLFCKSIPQVCSCLLPAVLANLMSHAYAVYAGDLPHPVPSGPSGFAAKANAH